MHINLIFLAALIVANSNAGYRYEIFHRYAFLAHVSDFYRLKARSSENHTSVLKTRSGHLTYSLGSKITIEFPSLIKNKQLCNTIER